MIEQYGDTPFATYETTIINNSPVSSLTVDVTIEKPNEDESIEIVKTNDGITQPPTISIPYTIEENTPLITNGNSDINKKYIKTRVPSDFYGEIKTESDSKVQKPKKRRL
jgi:cytoskeletal protein RodZ